MDRLLGGTRRAAAAVAIALALVGAGAAAAHLDHREGPRVAYVVDGDTIRLTDKVYVRLVQIDTPEEGTGECYSRAAAKALRRLLPDGSDVRLEADPHLDQVDRYGRLLRYVIRGGTNVNLELVRRGAAAPYFYRGERGRYAAALLRAAEQARAGRRGLWKACPSTGLDPASAVATGRSGPPAKVAPTTGKCDPNYAGGCVPPAPPDLDCADIRALGIAPVRVVGSDPHRLDGDGDGWGCE